MPSIRAIVNAALMKQESALVEALCKAMKRAVY